MAKEVISLVSDAEHKRNELVYKLQNKLLTKKDFDTMSPQDKDLVKQVLFELYTTDTLNIYASLSALEFAVMGLAKLFFQCVPNPTPATPTATPATPTATPTVDFYARLKGIISQHDIPMDPKAWQMDYLLSRMTTAQANRNQYFQEKYNVTGEI